MADALARVGGVPRRVTATDLRGKTPGRRLHAALALYLVAVLLPIVVLFGLILDAESSDWWLTPVVAAHVALGYAVGRWWATWLPLVVFAFAAIVELARLGDRDPPPFAMAVLFCIFFCPAVALGVLIRRAGTRLRHLSREH